MRLDILNCNKCIHKGTDLCRREIEYIHNGTVFDHTIEVLKNLDDEASFELQIAALFHDVGKNENTYKNRDGKLTFYNHEKEGSIIVRNILKRLKFSKKKIDYISTLIKHHMDIYKCYNLNDKSIRRLLRTCMDFIEDLIVLVDADCKGTLCLDKADNMLIKEGLSKEVIDKIFEVKREMINIFEKNRFKYFNGSELMEYFEIDKPCKEVGELLRIQDKIIDEYGFSLDKEKVIKMIKNRYYND